MMASVLYGGVGSGDGERDGGRTASECEEMEGKGCAQREEQGWVIEIRGREGRMD
jgi:hypothetical protein